MLIFLLRIHTTKPRQGNHSLYQESASRSGHWTKQQGAGQVRSIDVPLTVRAIAGLLLGLLTLQLLGDEVIAQRWEELPEVLTSLLFDGLQPGKETTPNEDTDSSFQ